MPFSVVTSKKAQQDFLNIQARHADILTGMITQKTKVDAYNQQKAVEKQNQQIMQNEMQKEQMAQGTIRDKNAMDYSLGNRELDIKKMQTTQT